TRPAKRPPTPSPSGSSRARASPTTPAAPSCRRCWTPARPGRRSRTSRSPTPTASAGCWSASGRATASTPSARAAPPRRPTSGRAEAANACRDLQNTPANDMTPTRLAERARELEADGVRVEVEGRDGIAARGMGAFAAVAQGTYEEPALVTLRYDPPAPGATGP